MFVSELYVRNLLEAGFQSVLHEDMLEFMDNRAGPAPAVAGDARAMVDKRDGSRNILAKMFVALDGAFRFSWWDLTPVLLFQQAFPSVLSSQSQYASRMSRAWLTTSLRYLRSLLPKSIWVLCNCLPYHVVRLRLQWCKATNSTMKMPGDSSDTRTYQEWVEFVNVIRNDVLRRTSSSEYQEAFLIRYLEREVMREQCTQNSIETPRIVGRTEELEAASLLANSAIMWSSEERTAYRALFDELVSSQRC